MRYMVDECGTLIDKETRKTYDYVSEVCPLLNTQNNKISNLNNLLSDYLPVWVIENVIKRRLKEANDENVKKELSMLLEELI